MNNSRPESGGLKKGASQRVGALHRYIYAVLILKNQSSVAARSASLGATIQRLRGWLGALCTVALWLTLSFTSARAAQPASGLLITDDPNEIVYLQADPVGTQTLTYDNEGNLLTLVEDPVAAGAPDTTITRVYDPLGRVTSYTDAASYVIAYLYDNEGNVTRITYPGTPTRAVEYTYDGAKRLKTVTDWAGRVTTYSYDTVGRLTTVDRPNTTRQRNLYDDTHRLTAAHEEKMSGVNITGTLWQADYGYDNADRLTSYTPTPAAKPYAPPATTLTYNNDNQIATYNGQSITHDLDGNILAVPVGTGTRGMPGTLLGAAVWDARNRLLSAGGVSYTYDAENRRLTSTVTATGATTQYIYHKGGALDNLLAKINPDGSVTRYVYGAGLLYEETTSSGGVAQAPVYYHYNWRGDTIAMSDSTGAVVARLAYSPYGERTVESGAAIADASPFGFNGRWGVMTEPTGLVCMQARFYSPTLRRFLSEDPSGFSGGVNLYAFVGGNPIDYMDPFGLGPVNNGGGLSFGETMSAAASGAWQGLKGAGLVAGGFIPYVGDALDVYDLAAPSSSGTDRLIAGASLGVNLATAGLAPT